MCGGVGGWGGGLRSVRAPKIQAARLHLLFGAVVHTVFAAYIINAILF